MRRACFGANFTTNSKLPSVAGFETSSSRCIPSNATNNRERIHTDTPGQIPVEDPFQDTADETLNCVFDTVESWVDSHELVDYDGSIQAGVVTLSFGTNGTFVLNKQAPARQLWLSSPISGPSHYTLCKERGDWVDARNGRKLLSCLTSELQSVTGLEGLRFHSARHRHLT